MADENDHRTIQAIVSALTEMKCFFIVTPEQNLYLVGPDNTFINIDRIPELFSSYSVGKYAITIQEILTIHPLPQAGLPHANAGFWGRLFEENHAFSSFNQDTRVWRYILQTYDKAASLAKELAEKYDVHVAILETDTEFFSDAAYNRTANEQVYFISKERPDYTYKFSQYLLEHQIRMEEVREKTYFREANAKRSEKANETAVQLSEKIATIKQEYRDSHDGKEPPLSRIAEILTEQQIESPSGGSKWFAQTVKRVLQRSEINR